MKSPCCLKHAMFQTCEFGHILRKNIHVDTFGSFHAQRFFLVAHSLTVLLLLPNGFGIGPSTFSKCTDSKRGGLHPTPHHDGRTFSFLPRRMRTGFGECEHLPKFVHTLPNIASVHPFSQITSAQLCITQSSSSGTIRSYGFLALGFAELSKDPSYQTEAERWPAEFPIAAMHMQVYGLPPNNSHGEH